MRHARRSDLRCVLGGIVVKVKTVFLCEFELLLLTKKRSKKSRTHVDTVAPAESHVRKNGS